MGFDDLVTQLHEGIGQYYNSESPDEIKATKEQLIQLCSKVAQHKEKAFPSHFATILTLVASGLKNKEIAKELELSTRTITNYLSIIYKMLGVRNRTEAVIVATRKGLIGEKDG